MDHLRSTYKRSQTLHHAYGIEGLYELVRGEVVAFLESDCGFRVVGNPDVQFLYHETFGIDESRSLDASAHRKALGATGKFFIAGCQTLTHEAQNALLKLFEDPPAQTTFFLIVPSHTQLLPTLRSRLYLLKKGEERDVNTSAAQKFLKASPAERLEIVAKIVEGKDKAGATHLVNGLEEILYSRQGEERTVALKRLAQVRTYIPDRSSSLKLILEHLALTLPAR